MSAAMERNGGADAPLPYADDLPPDGPQESLSLAWCSPEAELAALEATSEYDTSPTGTYEEKMANLERYSKARRLFAEGIGIQVWADGNLNRAADTGFLNFLDDFRARTPRDVRQRIGELRMQAARRKQAGARALQASLLPE